MPKRYDEKLRNCVALPASEDDADSAEEAPQPIKKRARGAGGKAKIAALTESEDDADSAEETPQPSKKRARGAGGKTKGPKAQTHIYVESVTLLRTGPGVTTGDFRPREAVLRPGGIWRIFTLFFRDFHRNAHCCNKTLTLA